MTKKKTQKALFQAFKQTQTSWPKVTKNISTILDLGKVRLYVNGNSTFEQTANIFDIITDGIEPQGDLTNI